MRPPLGAAPAGPGAAACLRCLAAEAGASTGGCRRAGLRRQPHPGTGATRERAYPEQLSALIGRKVINAGVDGETTAEGRERLPRLLEEVRPALVLLCLGGNDMVRRMDRAAMRENLAAMVRDIRGHGADVVLLAVPEPRLLRLQPEPAYETLARDFAIPLEGEAVTQVLGDRRLKSDEIHPNAEGYRRIAEAVAQLLRRAGAI